MELKVIRHLPSAGCTIGELLINDVHECFTLEDPVREPGVKIKGNTAIPPGRYKVIVNYSNRFKRDMPLIVSVPMFEGVRIHSGNTAADTEGCVLVGTERGDQNILHSRDAFAALFRKIQSAIAAGEEIHIEV